MLVMMDPIIFSSSRTSLSIWIPPTENREMKLTRVTRVCSPILSVSITKRVLFISD